MSSKHSNMILIGIVAGLVLAGIVVSAGGAFLPEETFRGVLKVCDLFGQLFLTALRMIIVPLVLASVIMGITSLGDVRRIGGVGLRTIGYYALTTALAVLLGVILVVAIEPGEGMNAVFGEADTADAKMESIRAMSNIGISDLVLSMLSSNIMESIARGEMLPIIVFALVFGGILTTLGEKGKPVIAFFDGVNEAMMKFVGLIMWIAPIGVFGLVASKFGAATLEPGGIGRMIEGVGKYSATVLIALFIHAFLSLFVVCAVLARRNPLQYIAAMFPAILTAWSTASSSATLPVTIDSAERRGDVDPKAAGFVLPLGATINMDGTALYEAVGAIFIAQAVGVELDFFQLLLVFITATIASIGAAGIPQAGLVMMVIVLNTVGLPLEGIGLILAIDWLLDRFRTAVNVWGDSIGAAYIHGFVR